MKIVTWNCNGAFRKKFEELSKLNADIFVIQECENPAESNHKEYIKWSKNYLWIGENKNKGVGVFVRNDWKLEKLDWSNKYKDHNVKYFLPCLINNDFQLLGVWLHQNNSPTFGYIGQLWKYLQENKPKFNNLILVGDFNSNKIWDKWDRWWNHSDVVNELKELEIESLYHLYFQEYQGEELQPTFFLQKNKKKPYHIDYIFSSKHFTKNLKKVTVGDKDFWLNISDHLPLVCEFH